MRLGAAVALLLAACRDPAPAAAPDASAAPRRPLVLTAAAPRATPDVAAPAARPVSPAAHADAGAAPRRSDGFLGADDAALLARICDAPVARIERNRGGSTISFKVRFENGQKALFKPQQRADVANFRAELAAYRMGRLLGLHRTPPACGRALPRAMLQRAADASGDAAFSQRVMTELLGRGELVPGAMLYWVPGALEPVPGAETYPSLLDAAQPLQAEARGLAGDLSALLLFDYVIDNVDRWSGGNILRQRAEGAGVPGPMLFMDNGASFSAIHDGLGARPTEQARRLAAMSRFPRALVERLRGLDAPAVRAAMAEDPLGPCLSDAQIAAVLTRRDRVLARVTEAVAAHGEPVAFAFP